MAYYTSDDYYVLLGLKPGASDAEIRQAYRRAAKLLHPDRNASASAHEDFILATEAYEYLISHRSSPTSSYVQSPTTTYEPPRPSYDWQSQAREEARRRAAEHASMRYDEFTDTDYYKSLESVGTVLRYGFMLLLILLVTGIVTVLITTSGMLGVFFSALFMILPVSLIYANVRNGEIDLTEFHESGVFLLGQTWVQAILITAFNAYAIAAYVCNTLLPMGRAALIYIGATAAALAIVSIARPKMDMFHRFFYSLCHVPLVISLCFAFNFTLASNPVHETYKYRVLRGG